MAEQRYRLHDGTLGTHYQALAEAVKTLEAQKQALEDRIELLRIEMQTAEGRE